MGNEVGGNENGGVRREKRERESKRIEGDGKRREITSVIKERKGGVRKMK